MARFKDLIAGKRLYFQKHQAYFNIFQYISYFPCFVVICCLKERSNSAKNCSTCPLWVPHPALPPPWLWLPIGWASTVIIASRTSSWRKTWCKSTCFTISRNTSMRAVRFRRFGDGYFWASGKFFSDLDFFFWKIKKNKRWLMVFGDVRTEPNYTYAYISCHQALKIFNKS